MSTKNNDRPNIRDYFAAKAMQSLIVAGAATPACSLSIIHTGNGLHKEAEKRISVAAYAMADAMLAERSKEDAK